MSAKNLNRIYFKNIGNYSAIGSFYLYLPNGFFEVDLLNVQNVFVKISVRRTSVQQKGQNTFTLDFDVYNHQTALFEPLKRVSLYFQFIFQLFLTNQYDNSLDAAL